MDNKKVDREKLYEQFYKLNKNIKAQPKSLETEDGMFILDWKDKSQREWYENDDDFGIYGGKD